MGGAGAKRVGGAHARITHIWYAKYKRIELKFINFFFPLFSFRPGFVCSTMRATASVWLQNRPRGRILPTVFFSFSLRRPTTWILFYFIFLIHPFCIEMRKEPKRVPYGPRYITSISFSFYRSSQQQPVPFFVEKKKKIHSLFTPKGEKNKDSKWILLKTKANGMCRDDRNFLKGEEEFGCWLLLLLTSVILKWGRWSRSMLSVSSPKRSIHSTKSILCVSFLSSIFPYPIQASDATYTHRPTICQFISPHHWLLISL